MNQTQFNFPTAHISPKVKNWLRLMETGELRNKTVVVLRHIHNQPLGTTIHYLRDATGFPHQSLTSVLSALMDAGMVKVCGETMEGVNYYSVLHFVHTDAERLEVAEQRSRDKYAQWIKRGMEEFENRMSVVLMSALKMEK